VFRLTFTDFSRGKMPTDFQAKARHAGHFAGIGHQAHFAYAQFAQNLRANTV
jgi:hypothetical protein